MKISILFASFIIILMVNKTLHAERIAKIIYFNKPSSAPKIISAYQLNADPIKVELNEFNFSTPIELSATTKTLIFLPEDYVVKDGLPKNAPRVNIPIHWEKVLIMAFNDPKNQIIPIKLKAINASDSVFKKGDTMYVNLSKSIVYGFVGEEKLLVKPGGTVLTGEPVRNDEAFKVRLQKKDPESGDAQWFIRRTWRYEPTRKGVIFFYQNEESGQLTYYPTYIHSL